MWGIAQESVELPTWLVIAGGVAVFLLTMDRFGEVLLRRLGGGVGWFARRTISKELEAGELVSPEQFDALKSQIDTRFSSVDTQLADMADGLETVKGQEEKILSIETKIENGLTSRMADIETRQEHMDGKLDVIVAAVLPPND